MPRRPRASHCWDDRGSATAETAIVLPVVVVMVLVVLLTGAGIGSQVRLENAAGAGDGQQGRARDGGRAAAREMARGEEQSAAVATAQRVGGDGTSVHISGDGTWVQVEVTRTLRAGSGVLAGASWELSAEAQSRREPHLVDGQGPADGQGP